MSLLSYKEYEKNLIKHGFQKVILKGGFSYYVKRITDKKEIESIEKLDKITWNVSTMSLFRQAITEFNLINYLEEIKPFTNNPEYYE